MTMPQYPPQDPYGYPPRPSAPQNGLGTAGLVLGIVGLVLSFTIVIGFICGLLGVIFGSIGRGRARSGLATNGGAATAGIVTGGFAIAIAVLLVAAFATSGGHACFHIGSRSNPCGYRG